MNTDLSGYRIQIQPGEDNTQWVNTKGWFKVATPNREAGDEIICTYGRYIGAVAFVLFEDERDAMMAKLNLK